MKYTITDTGNGWLLKIWEPSPTEGDRVLPFLYKIKTIHPTSADAREALAYHEQVNQLKAAV
ncbi:MAG TPA: hypothetical protein V6C88_04580 [Chroococcidiopsis sp.]